MITDVNGAVGSIVTAQTAAEGANVNAATSSLTADFDTFLTLLTTQLRNQDPLDPLDTDRFTEQLVQFSGVEQSIGTNTRLDALIALQSGSDKTNALSLVGRPVAFDGDSAALTASGAEWTYSLPGNAGAVALSVQNETGETVATFAGETTRGDHQFRWTGLDDNGDPLSPGLYRLSIDATDPGGAPLQPSIAGVLPVIAATFINGATQLETLAGVTDLDAVRRVTAE